MCCAGEVRQLEAKLTPLPGVTKLGFDLVGRRLTVEGVLGVGAIQRAVRETGMIARAEGQAIVPLTFWKRRGRVVMAVVSGILLAAGAATRFGADKLAAEFCGQTLLHRSAAAMADAELQPVIAVAQPNASHSVPGGVRAVENDRWKSGISTSVRAGLAALHRETSVCAAIVAPADQPWCGPDVYRRLVDAFRRTGRGLIVATFHGAIRNPVLVARAHWRLADEIDGAIGEASMFHETFGV